MEAHGEGDEGQDEGHDEGGAEMHDVSWLDDAEDVDLVRLERVGGVGRRQSTPPVHTWHPAPHTVRSAQRTGSCCRHIS